MTIKSEEMIGKKFGNWEVIKEDGKLYNRKAYLCRCICGKLQRINGNELRRGKTKQCMECSAKKRSKFINGIKTSEHKLYSMYKNMIDRCENIKNKSYKNYGARGINVCEKWKNSFLDFTKDMGEKPNGTRYSIDRIDNNGNYCPENCRWATDIEQANNRRPRIASYISYHKDKRGYQVEIKGNFIGRYKTKEEAILKRDEYINKNNLKIRIKYV